MVGVPSGSGWTFVVPVLRTACRGGHSSEVFPSLGWLMTAAFPRRGARGRAVGIFLSRNPSRRHQLAAKYGCLGDGEYMRRDKHTSTHTRRKQLVNSCSRRQQLIMDEAISPRNHHNIMII